jgi:predicted Na+-dependent transporter
MRRRTHTRTPSILLVLLLVLLMLVLLMVLGMLVARRFLRRRHKIRRKRKRICKVERNHIHRIIFVRLAQYIIEIAVVGWCLRRGRRSASYHVRDQRR